VVRIYLSDRRVKSTAPGFGGMSSVGFTVQSKDEEVEKLREAWKTLNDLLKNLANAEACLKNLDLKLTGDHLKVVKWNAEQVKKAIAVVGQSQKNQRADR
jgi:hypothetical protein